MTKVEIVENSALLAGIVTKRLESHGVPIKWHPQIEDVENGEQRSPFATKLVFTGLDFTRWIIHPRPCSRVL